MGHDLAQVLPDQLVELVGGGVARGALLLQAGLGPLELAGCLLNLGYDERLGELLERYEEEASAFWVYTRALWAFRQGGASEEATAVLEEAVQTNPHVAQYLLGWKGFPEALEELMDYGEEGEAVTYFVRYLASWLRTPGAVEWLRDNVAEETLESL